MVGKRAKSRRRWPLVVLAVSGLVIAPTAALGGFRAAEEPGPPSVRPGETIDQGLFRTEVLRAYAGTRDEEDFAGSRWLTVEFRVTNMSKESRDDMLFVADGSTQLVVATTPDGRRLDLNITGRNSWVEQGARDGNLIPPEVPVTVNVAWEVKTGPYPRRVTLDLAAFELWKPAIFDAASEWGAQTRPNETSEVDDDPVVMAGRVTLPVSRRDAS